jgi:Uma2 family endonuclease
MARAEILREDDRVELVEGEVVQMSPVSSRHAGAVNRLVASLARLQVEGRAVVSIQNPVEFGEPQPDVAVMRPRPDFYGTAHPGPEDVLLLVELAETSAEYDRQVKVPLYARWGFPEVWVVDLEGADGSLPGAYRPDFDSSWAYESLGGV